MLQNIVVFLAAISIGSKIHNGDDTPKDLPNSTQRTYKNLSNIFDTEDLKPATYFGF
jgi:hypothetical protein